MKRMLLTGGTGTMGSAALKELGRRGPDHRLTLLVRDSKANRRKMNAYAGWPHLDIVWGDLTDPEAVAKAAEGCDIILHAGGMVSPAADYYPEKTLATNTGAMRNIVEAVKAMPPALRPAIVYIGSVSQYGPRRQPDHWVDAGDSMRPARFDSYALSKIEAERILAESGLERWASLRLGSILSAALLKKGTDPITFHVPLEGVLEWTTDEDCGRLIANFLTTDLPDDFWRRFYNIGSGEDYRLTYYEFERRLLKALDCPPVEKIFERNWFATDNFHGAWFRDSDVLENYLHFRGDVSCDEHFERMRSTLPFYFRLTPLAPARLIKTFMKPIVYRWPFGPLSWIERSDPERPDSGEKGHAEERMNAFFGSRLDWEEIGSWDEYRPSSPARHCMSPAEPLPARISNLTTQRLTELAESKGGRLIDSALFIDSTGEEREKMADRQIEWECACGHRFKMRPRSILLGGHWCPECMKEICRNGERHREEE